MKIKITQIIWIVVVTVMSLYLLTTANFAQAANIDNAFVQVKGDRFILNKQPFVMKGFNYYPSHYGLASMTEWDWNEVDKELAAGASLGANTVRAFIDYGYSVGDPDYSLGVATHYHLTPEYLVALNKFLTIANKHGLKVIFGLFGYMPGYQFKKEGDNATPKKYLAELVTHFVNDPRIMAWELMSEGDLMPKKFGTDYAQVERFYEDMSKVARQYDPNHLTTIGFADISMAYTVQDLVDFISFHYYPDPALLTPQINNLRNKLNHPMPIVEAEFGSPAQGKPGASLSRHMVNLGANLDIALNFEHLAGALFWQLLDLDVPKTALNRMGEKQSHLKFGVFDENLQAKPSATLVRNFFTHEYNLNNKITFKYTEANKTPLGYRVLAVKIGGMQFLDENHSVLKALAFGTIEANLLQGQGWYANEAGGQWLGNINKTSTLYINIPASTKYIVLQNVVSASASNKLQLWIKNRLIGVVTVFKQPNNYTIILNDELT
jgi:hypothetical protein